MEQIQLQTSAVKVPHISQEKPNLTSLIWTKTSTRTEAPLIVAGRRTWLCCLGSTKLTRFHQLRNHCAVSTRPDQTQPAVQRHLPSLPPPVLIGGSRVQRSERALEQLRGRRRRWRRGGRSKKRKRSEEEEEQEERDDDGENSKRRRGKRRRR